MMTELSPAAQAVWDAYEAADCNPYETDPRRASLSDAFSALADQVVPEEKLLMNARGTSHWHKAIQRAEARSKLLTIAAELRGITTTQETL